MSKAIETAIRSERWEKARRLIQAALKREPHSHWLMTRLSLTYYEQYKYRRSLSYCRKALKIAPRCPLVLWDYAGTLQMLEKHRAALKVYRQLLSRRIEEIAHGECGEGISRARGLMADCYYRQGFSFEALNQKRAASESYRKHLRMRGRGCQSIYKVREVRKRLSELA